MPLGVVSLLPMLATLVALPLVARAFPAGPERRRAGGLLLGLFLSHAGLYLLFWSVTACWALVGLGAVTIAATASSWRRRGLVLVVSAAALALGLAFELTGGDVGILVYVAGAVPILLGGAAALALASWLRWDSSPRALLSAAAVVCVFTVIPFTSFYPSFLLTFEPAHLPLLALAFAGLLLLARAAPGRATAAHPMSAGELTARPLPSAGGWLVQLAALAAFLATVARETLIAREPGGAAVVFVAATAALVLRGRLVGAQLALLANAVTAARAAIDMQALDASPWAAVALAAGSVGATIAALALALALARERELESRDAAARHEALVLRGPKMPSPAMVREADRATPAHLADLQRAAAAAGELRAVLLVRAPAQDPLWTVDEPTYEWLADQRGAVRVHVAIVEGAQASFIPPLFGAEVEA